MTPKGHMLVCGAGATGRHILEEMFATRTPVVVIDTDEEVLAAVREQHPDAQLETIAGDATDDTVLERAGLDAARCIAAVLPEDKDNLYIVVAARQANATARIVARVREVSHADKLKRVGADAVVMSNYIGARRMATEMLRPVFARFLDDMLKDPGNYRLNEVTIEAGSTLAGKTLRDARVREQFGMSVLAISKASEPWRYNPEETEVLGEGTTLIVLGSIEQVEEMKRQSRQQS